MPRDPGAWGLSEIIPASPGDAAAAAGFASALALRAAAARPRGGVVWIVEDMAAREIGLPHGVGVEARGLDLARLVLVRTRDSSETFWAMEEALKSRAVAIVAESWIAPRAYGLVASRRLSTTARRGGGLGLLLLPRASGRASRLTSAAPLRFEVAPLPAAPRPMGREPPPPGAPGWRLRIAKARAGLVGLGEIDPLAWFDLAWPELPRPEPV